MTVILIGAHLVICGVLYMAGKAIWQGRLSGASRRRTMVENDDPRAANARHCVRSQIELDRTRARGAGRRSCCLQAPPCHPELRQNRAELSRNRSAFSHITAATPH